MDAVVTIASLLLNLISIAVIARALLSWFYNVGGDPFTRVLVNVTEPLLAPVRALLSRVMPIPIDFSPIVVILLLQLLDNMLRSSAR